MLSVILAKKIETNYKVSNDVLSLSLLKSQYLQFCSILQFESKRLVRVK